MHTCSPTHVHAPICFACLSPHIPHFELPYTSSSSVSPLMLLYLAKLLSLTGFCLLGRIFFHVFFPPILGEPCACMAGFPRLWHRPPPPRPMETQPNSETSAPMARVSCSRKHGHLHLLSSPGDYAVFFPLIPTPVSFAALHFLAIPSIISASWNTEAYLW